MLANAFLISFCSCNCQDDRRRCGDRHKDAGSRWAALREELRVAKEEAAKTKEEAAKAKEAAAEADAGAIGELMRLSEFLAAARAERDHYQQLYHQAVHMNDEVVDHPRGSSPSSASTVDADDGEEQHSDA